MNVSNLPLHVFSLYAVVNCKLPPIAPPFAVLHDINIVLGKIPEPNRVTNLWLEILTVGRRSFHGCLNQDWVEMFNEIIRIAGGKPLELELNLVIFGILSK